MTLDDFAWSDAPEPRRHRTHWVGWTTFWLVVTGAAVSLGWVIATALISVEKM